MKKTILYILCLCFLNVSYSQDSLDLDGFNSDDILLGYIYQQPRYLKEDPVGDLLLLDTMKQLPRSIYSQLKGTYEEEYKYRNEIFRELNAKYPNFSKIRNDELIYDYTDLKDQSEDFKVAVEGNKRPFIMKNTKQMLLQVITDMYLQKKIIPQSGEPHSWSDTFLQAYQGQYIISKRLSKLLSCLARGVCSRYMVTGKENDLYQYIVDQEYASITIDRMLSKSYEINDGDIYLTLLTIENVLSRYWDVQDRENLALTKRLKPFTNYHYDTDVFGQWYHLFGVMLYGYVEGSFKSKSVGAIEGLGSLILCRFEPERQENAINIQGAELGAYLKKIMKNGLYRSFSTSEEYLQENYYLRKQDMSRIVKRKIKKNNRK